MKDDQPITCEKCGARTMFDYLPDGNEWHVCLGCGFTFMMDIFGWRFDTEQMPKKIRIR